MARILKVEHWQPRFEYNDEEYLKSRGDEVERLLLFAGQDAPDPRRYDLAIAYGGYMSAYDDAAHPWIARELRFLEACLKAGTPVLGICLGSQLLARLLGARVYRSPLPEFGFKRVFLNRAGAADPALGALDPSGSGFMTIEWHDDAWDLPAGAELLAASSAWPNQAFRCGSALAIQFHLEFTQPHMAWSLAESGESPAADPAGEDPAAFSAPGPRYAEVAGNMRALLAGLLDGRGKAAQGGAGAAGGAVAASRAAR